MSRSTTMRAWMLIAPLLITWSTTVSAQVTPIEITPASPTTPPPTDAAPPPAPVVEPVVITAGTPEAKPDATAPAAAAPTSPTPPATQVELAPSSAQENEAGDGEDSDDEEASEARSCVSLFGVVDHRWNTATGFDLFSDDDVTHFYGLALAYDIAALTDQLTLALELGWNTGSTHRNDLLGVEIRRTELSTHNVIAAATARYDLLPWLAPHARMSLGLSVVDMQLEGAQDGTFKDQAIAPMLGLGVGASVQTPLRALASRQGDLASLQLGVRFELGYTLAGNTAFSLHADDKLRVPVSDASLGGLSRSGPYIHSAIFARL